MCLVCVVCVVLSVWRGWLGSRHDLRAFGPGGVSDGILLVLGCLNRSWADEDLFFHPSEAEEPLVGAARLAETLRKESKNLPRDSTS